MCPRCQGLVIQGPPFEEDTGPSYHCVNCGFSFDALVAENIVKQQKGWSPREKHVKSTRASVGDDAYRVLGSGAVLLGRDSVSDLV